MADLPEQHLRLGEQIEFFDLYRGRWLKGIVYEANLMGNGTISYGCLADNGFSLDRRELGEQVRPLSAVVKLGDLAP